MTKGYLLDTDFVLWHFRNVEPRQVLLQLLKEKGIPSISVLSFYEIESRVEFEDGWGQRVPEFLKSLNVCDVNASIAAQAAGLIKEYPEMNMLCAFIAATCLHHHLTLVTRHPELYPMPELLRLVPERMEHDRTIA